MNNIGITMIGHSGSGKSCYLYAMYAQMAFGVNGFTFMPEDFDKALMLENKWTEIVENGIWPEGTLKSTDYTFNCSHSFRKLLTFNWYDYRGHSIRESESKDRGELFIRLNNSNTLIICISSETIRGLNMGGQEHINDLRKYNLILNEYFKNNSRKVNIAIAITKADLLYENDFIEGIRILKDQYLHTLFQKGGNLFVMFVPVTLGIGLSSGKNKEISGEISPKNIHLPVMFAIYSAFNQLLEIEEHQKAESESGFRKESGKSSWKKFWDGDGSSELYKQITKSNDNIELIKNDLQRIINELKTGCVLYYDGNKIIF